MLVSIVPCGHQGEHTQCLKPFCFHFPSAHYPGDRMSHHNLYGATEAMISKGQSQAKTRVIIFLTVFLITGFFS